jgi:thymidylate synthase (FAD)
MQHIEVELFHHTPTWVVERAVSKPYQHEPVEGRAERVIAVKKHTSEAEFLGYWFDIRGMSRLCLMEMTRHRIASYSVESTRYTLRKALQKHQEGADLHEFFVTPMRNGTVDDALAAYVYQTAVSFMAHAHELLEQSYKQDEIKYLLPESWRTNAVVHMNARSFANFAALRTESHAHFEIRHVAGLMVQAIPEDQRFILPEQVRHEFGL